MPKVKLINNFDFKSKLKERRLGLPEKKQQFYNGRVGQQTQT